MAAPKENKFWKLRSKHGRDKLFKTPTLMWDAACEYFDWCEKNPFLETEAKVVSAGNNKGSDIETVEIPKMRPFTMQGLCLYLNCNTAYFRDFKDGLKGKTDKLAKDFSSVIATIEDTVYNQKFSGAAAGFLNANIIARDLGLKDNTDITTGGEKLPEKDTHITLSNGTRIPL